MERKRALLRLVENHAPCEEERLIAVFSLQTGLRGVRIREYLLELADAGLILLEEGQIRLPEKEAPP